MKFSTPTLASLWLVLHTTQAFTTPLQSQTFASKKIILNASNRRDFLQSIPLSTVLIATTSTTFSPSPANAGSAVTTASSGLLPDLPPDAVRSYLQYRTPLQISADFYLFDLRDQLQDTQTWGEVGSVFNSQNSRGGQGQPSPIERNFVNPMRILGLSMPPDVGEDMRTAQFEFERAMAKISKVTSGIRRDLPVEISKDAVPDAMRGWEEGRVALNKFFTLCNEATGLPNELKVIPAGSGDAQWTAYKRSPRKYNELTKKTKLCQNRGGPTLSAAWGQLMVSGYLQDSCGIPDMEGYFFQ